jgi:LPPG:FO 2-phospho-L-lactate transferase
MGTVVALTGQVGGAKLVDGLYRLRGKDLAAIVNTGDDYDHLTLRFSPDIDTVLYVLAGIASPSAPWEPAGESHALFGTLKRFGGPDRLSLGDRSLAAPLLRTAWLAEDRRLTAITLDFCRQLGITARVLPMSDDPVRTWIRSGSGWFPFQEFMIRERAQGLVEGLEFRGAEQAAPCQDVLTAIAGARAIVIGPSNPLASIAPILAVPGLRDALIAADAPVVAVSPIVGGLVLKGPTASFMAFAALELSADGVADFYGELLDGIVADENVSRIATLQTDTRMDDAQSRARVAEQTLGFAEALTG